MLPRALGIPEINELETEFKDNKTDVMKVYVERESRALKILGTVKGATSGRTKMQRWITTLILLRIFRYWLLIQMLGCIWLGLAYVDGG
jgi:hypothetical protein